jgi:hypothetical protein
VVLATELGGTGVRLVGLRPTAIPESVASSHTSEPRPYSPVRALDSLDSNWLGAMPAGSRP